MITRMIDGIVAPVPDDEAYALLRSAGYGREMAKRIIAASHGRRFSDVVMRTGALYTREEIDRLAEEGNRE